MSIAWVENACRRLGSTSSPGLEPWQWGKSPILRSHAANRHGKAKGLVRERLTCAFLFVVYVLPSRRRELAELVAHHVLGDGHGVVHFAIVDEELEPDEARQDGGRPRLRPDRRCRLVLLWSDDWEAMGTGRQFSVQTNVGRERTAQCAAPSTQIALGGTSSPALLS